MYARSSRAHHLEALVKGDKPASVTCDDANANKGVERA
jgi:hypothetical protein